jgi:hypothetical protein
MATSAGKIALGVGCGILAAVMICIGSCVACFGYGVHKMAQQATTVTPSGATGGGTSSDGWSERITQSTMDNSTIVTLTLRASNDVTGWLTSTRPSLVLRCEEHKTNVYVATGLSSTVELGRFQEHTVRLRLDDGKAERSVWSESTDNRALFAPNPVALAHRLARAQTLRFEFTPFNANTQIAEFALQGLRDHLQKLDEACGRKGRTPHAD